MRPPIVRWRSWRASRATATRNRAASSTSPSPETSLSSTTRSLALHRTSHHRFAIRQHRAEVCLSPRPPSPGSLAPVLPLAERRAPALRSHQPLAPSLPRCATARAQLFAAEGRGQDDVGFMPSAKRLSPPQRGGRRGSARGGEAPGPAAVRAPQLSGGPSAQGYGAARWVWSWLSTPAPPACGR